MVVCHCEAVNDAAIRAALTSGGDVGHGLTVDDVVARSGAGGHCGGCHDTIRSILAALMTVPRETPMSRIGSHALSCEA